MIYVVPQMPDDLQAKQRVIDLNRELRRISDDATRQEREWERRWWAATNDNFVLTSDHIKLLKAMHFRLVEGADVASVAADGKRPFGNGDWVEDIYRVLGWTATYGPEGMDAASVERALRIMAQLPRALNQLLEELPT